MFSLITNLDNNTLLTIVGIILTIVSYIYDIRIECHSDFFPKIRMEEFDPTSKLPKKGIAAKNVIITLVANLWIAYYLNLNFLLTIVPLYLFGLVVHVMIGVKSPGSIYFNNFFRRLYNTCLKKLLNIIT